MSAQTPTPLPQMPDHPRPPAVTPLPLPENSVSSANPPKLSLLEIMLEDLPAPEPQSTNTRDAGNPQRSGGSHQAQANQANAAKENWPKIGAAVKYVMGAFSGLFAISLVIPAIIAGGVGGIVDAFGSIGEKDAAKVDESRKWASRLFGFFMLPAIGCYKISKAGEALISLEKREDVGTNQSTIQKEINNLKAAAFPPEKDGVQKVPSIKTPATGDEVETEDEG